MSFDLGQLFSPASLLLGTGIGSLGLAFLDKKLSKGSDATIDATAAEAIAQLQAELDSNKEEQAKVTEVHAYARTLEEKIQQLESTTESADTELRVKVLEKQLSEKADLESRLAVALQQLEDYKAKAEMYDSVMGTKASETPKLVEETADVEEVANLDEVAEPVLDEVAEIETIETEEVAVAETSVDAEPAEVKEVATVIEVEEVATAVEPIEIAPAAAEAVEEDPLAAVAASESAIEMKLVENQSPAANLSPAGSVAPAIEERPALRVESSVDVAPGVVIDPSDPLEKIEGIGQVYQAKLYEAGIRTFAQLAAASPSRITEVIEPQNWQQIDVMKWRREAALYASGEKA